MKRIEAGVWNERVYNHFFGVGPREKYMFSIQNKHKSNWGGDSGMRGSGGEDGNSLNDIDFFV